MKASLRLDGSDKTIKVLDFDYGLTQYTDDTGKPVGFPTGGTINMVVESTEDTQLIDWMISPMGMKNGVIEVEHKKVKKIEFEKAFCIQYHESFSHMGGEEPMSISITISAETVRSEFLTLRI